MQNNSIIFPGQGAQFVAMGKEIADSFPEAKEIFEQLDENLSQNLSKIIFHGPIEELTMTSNTQPALMAVSMAILAVLEKQVNFNIAKECRFVAGHSLGEYTALTAVKSLDFATSSKILRLRGESMQNSSPLGVGSMVALMGVTIEEAELLVNQAKQGEICQIANDNTIGQIVVSGHKTAIERISMLAKDQGKKAIILPVSAAFHSGLMNKATVIMKKALEEVDFQEPIVELVANVTARPTKDPALIRNLLVEQIEGRVRWRESIIYMKENNINNYLEIGASKVLAGLVKKIDPDASITNINDVASLNQFMEKFSS